MFYSIILFSGIAFAKVKVKGPCSNCHAMHNSQNRENIYEIPNFGPPDSPRYGGPGAYLLKINCISCHSSWDYEEMIAGDSTKSGGCFTRHTQKNISP